MKKKIHSLNATSQNHKFSESVRLRMIPENIFVLCKKKRRKVIHNNTLSTFFYNQFVTATACLIAVLCTQSYCNLSSITSWFILMNCSQVNLDFHYWRERCEALHCKGWYRCDVNENLWTDKVQERQKLCKECTVILHVPFVLSKRRFLCLPF